MLPGQFPQPARQWRLRHRRRHGDQHPAAQCRRAVRRGAASHQVPQRHRRQAGRFRARARSSRPAASSSSRATQIVQAYKTGRGSFRLRARWTQEDTGRGTYQIVVTEIPYQIPKARLVARIAELLQAEEAAAARRRARRVDRRRCGSCSSRRAAPSIPTLLMESMFKLTELETRVQLNMNVLSRGQVPNVLGLRQVLARMARPPPGGAGSPLEIPPRQDRPPARGARRLSDRLSQHRQGHQNHPREGRAEAGLDEGVQAHRSAGRGDPQYAAPLVAQARGDGDQARAR